MMKTRGGIDGLLDEGSHIRGELHFEDTFKVSGKITGSVISKRGSLDLYEMGEIDGEIHVHQALISGTVRGSLHADRVEVTSSGKIMADLHAPTLIIHEGAFFEGRCFMRASTPAAEKAPEKVTPMPSVARKK